MPRVIPNRQRKWKDDELVVAWETFAGSNVERVIRRGDRLRGGDPIVKGSKLDVAEQREIVRAAIDRITVLQASASVALEQRVRIVFQD